MTKAIFFDTFSGISGDMTLGALLHAGMPLEYLSAELAKLELPNFHLEARPTAQHGIGGIKLEVVVENPDRESHRHSGDICEIIERSSLPDRVKERAIQVFRALAVAEGKVHRVDPEHVHFHEVGALDSIVDIVGACIGFEFFEIEEFFCGPLPLGSGFVNSAHGLIPVPAPATLQLLEGVDVNIAPQVTLGNNVEYPGRFEMVTPTGAALVATICRFDRPAIRIEKTGYGFGSKECPWPNALRVWIGQTGNKTGLQAEIATSGLVEGAESDLVSVLETNLDDMLPEGLGYLMEKLLSGGALDVYFTPIQMKKNRPGVMLGIVARPGDEARFAELVLRETSAFGLRISRHSRVKAGRALREVETENGTAQVKLKILGDSVIEVAPEYESVAAIARATGRPWQEVYDAVHVKGQAFVQG